MPLPFTMEDFKNEIKKCIIKTLPKILKGGSTSKKIFCVVVAHKTEKINGKDLDELVCNSFKEFLQGEKDKNKYARIKCPRVFVFSKTEAALFLGFSRTIPSSTQYSLQHFYFPLDKLQLFGEDFQNREENNMIPASFNYQQWTGDTKCQYEKEAKEDIFEHFVEVYQSNETRYYGFTNKKGDNIVFLPSSADESKLQEINHDNIVNIIGATLQSYTNSIQNFSFAEAFEDVDYNEDYASHFTMFDEMLETIISRDSWKTGQQKLNIEFLAYFYKDKDQATQMNLKGTDAQTKFSETMTFALKNTDKNTILKIYASLKLSFSTGDAMGERKVYEFKVQKKSNNESVNIYLIETSDFILGFSDDKEMSYQLCVVTSAGYGAFKQSAEKLTQILPNNYQYLTLSCSNFNDEQGDTNIINTNEEVLQALDNLSDYDDDDDST